MAVQLVVTSPFEDYAVGDRITDAAEVARLAGGPFVVAAASPPEPPPTEKELQERAEALAELERLKAKLGDAVPGGISQAGTGDAPAATAEKQEG